MRALCFAEEGSVSYPCGAIGKRTPILFRLSKRHAYGGEMANAQRLDDSGTAFAPRAS